MLFELHYMFRALLQNKKSRGSFNHRKFILALKATNALFDNDEHHDSHEFINWLLDTVHEQSVKHQQGTANSSEVQFIGMNEPSFISSFFKGELQNKVTCVTCETTTNRKEPFFNLSLDLERNTSLINCMKRFSVKELLNQDNKLMCETCLSMQVATKEISVSKYPKILLLQLKRFRIDPQTFMQ